MAVHISPRLHCTAIGSGATKKCGHGVCVTQLLIQTAGFQLFQLFQLLNCFNSFNSLFFPSLNSSTQLLLSLTATAPSWPTSNAARHCAPLAAVQNCGAERPTERHGKVRSHKHQQQPTKNHVNHLATTTKPTSNRQPTGFDPFNRASSLSVSQGAACNELRI